MSKYICKTRGTIINPKLTDKIYLDALLDKYANSKKIRLTDLEQQRIAIVKDFSILKDTIEENIHHNGGQRNYPKPDLEYYDKKEYSTWRMLV